MHIYIKTTIKEIQKVGFVHCNILQRIATHYNTLQRTATHCNDLQHTTTHTTTCQTQGEQQGRAYPRGEHLATHCNTIATQYNTLQHPASHCNALLHTTTHQNRGEQEGGVRPINGSAVSASQSPLLHSAV